MFDVTQDLMIVSLESCDGTSSRTIGEGEGVRVVLVVVVDEDHDDAEKQDNKEDEWAHLEFANMSNFAQLSETISWYMLILGWMQSIDRSQWCASAVQSDDLHWPLLKTFHSLPARLSWCF